MHLSSRLLDRGPRISTTQRRPRLARHAVRAIFAALHSASLSTAALAQASGGGTTGSDPVDMLKAVASFIHGPFGQSIAIIGIIAIGLSWMFGRASLGMIAGVIGGIVIMFGASYMATELLGTTP